MGDQNRLAQWARKKIDLRAVRPMKSLLRTHGLNTVCESARCPNQTECFGRGTATFMIMGDICTRNCGFCAVRSGIPLPLDREEPSRIAEAVRLLSLTHVVVTSVARDDLSDHGAGHFAETVRRLRDVWSAGTIEVLTSDLGGKKDALEIILESRPDIFNHNVETVPSLYPKIRRQADYARSLSILREASRWGSGMMVKSGFMVGLGESPEDVKTLLRDLKDSGCSVVTIGQYLRPTLQNVPVVEYLPLEKFRNYEDIGTRMGFTVAAAPFVRSSYRAEALAHRVHRGLVREGNREDPPTR